MEKALIVINELEKQSLIQRYAVGGGIALLFYTEPILTYDLDVFVFLPPSKESSKPLLNLHPIYNYLKHKGYQFHKEHIMIEGVPVQFIPAYNELVEEALQEAIETKYKEIPTRVIQLEHLLAIMLQTDRPKDRTRIVTILAETEIKDEILKKILKRHNLDQKWEEFRRKFSDQKT